MTARAEAFEADQACTIAMSANGRNENGKVTSRISSTSRVKGRKPYKVVLESVTQEKKRLVSSVRRLSPELIETALNTRESGVL